MQMNENMGKRLELLLVGIKRGVVSKDGKIEGKAIVDMSYEEVNKWIEKLIEEQ
jgi:hypothetical protein